MDLMYFMLCSEHWRINGSRSNKRRKLLTCFTNSLFKVYNNLSLRETGPEVYNTTLPNRMLQWCHDHTGNVVMDITMFYVILLVINVTLLCIYYEMCCSVLLLWSQTNKVIWSAQNQLSILYYQVFISDVKWCGVKNT